MPSPPVMVTIPRTSPTADGARRRPAQIARGPESTPDPGRPANVSGQRPGSAPAPSPRRELLLGGGLGHRVAKRVGGLGGQALWGPRRVPDEVHVDLGEARRADTVPPPGRAP